MEKNKSGNYKWVILALMWVGVFIGSYAQYQLSPLAGELIGTMGLDNSQFASLIGAPMWFAIFFGLFGGALSDKFGVKKMVAFGFVFSVIGLFLRINAASYGMFFIAMVLSGGAATFLTPNRSKVLQQWFGPENLSVAMGICLTTSGLAQTLAIGTTAMLPSMKVAFTIAFVACLVIGICWILFMKDSPMQADAGKTQEAKQAQNAESLLDCLKVALKSKNIWLTGMALLCVMVFTSTFNTFLPKILNEVRGFDSVKAGAYATPISMGSCISGLIVPWIYKKVGKYKPCLLAFSILGAALAFISWQAPEGIIMIVATFMTGFFMGASFPLLMSFPVLFKEIGPRYAASAGGLVATIQLLASPLVIPYIVTPFAGTSVYKLLGAACVFMLLMGVIVLFLPALGMKAKKEQ